MVSPLFIEIFGGLVFLAILRFGVLLFIQNKIPLSKNYKIDQRFYIKALNDYFKKPQDLAAKESVFRMGHLFYSYDYPDREKKDLLELILDDTDIQNAKAKREYLISKDLSRKKMVA